MKRPTLRRTASKYGKRQGDPARPRRTESQEHRRIRAVYVLTMLHEAYPVTTTALVHRTPFEMLIATILSAQCTDQRVNMVTKDLFVRYRTPQDVLASSQDELEEMIRSTGFFRMKAKNILGCCKALVERHGGVVPSTLEELTALPGVGRKTANVVLSEVFGKSEGIVVDTHVHRIARRLGLSTNDDPVRIERDLMEVIERREWQTVGGLFIQHGRKTCVARKPACFRCPVASVCPSVQFPEPGKPRAVRPQMRRRAS